MWLYIVLPAVIIAAIGIAYRLYLASKKIDEIITSEAVTTASDNERGETLLQCFTKWQQEGWSEDERLEALRRLPRPTYIGSINDLKRVEQTVYAHLRMKTSQRRSSSPS